jgi:hypothetical protein
MVFRLETSRSIAKQMWLACLRCVVSWHLDDQRESLLVLYSLIDSVPKRSRSVRLARTTGEANMYSLSNNEPVRVADDDDLRRLQTSKA